MKKFGIIMMFSAVILQCFSQESSAEKGKGQRTAVKDTNEITRVIIGRDRVVIEDDQERVKVRVGDRGVTILESLEGERPKVDFEYYRDEDSYRRQDDDDDDDNDNRWKRNSFKGHWAGIEFGFNNYLTTNNSITLPDEISYMTLHSGKAMNFNLNFSQISLGLTRRIGFVTGLGLNWNNYRFDGNNNIQKGTDGTIEIFDPGENLKKSKFTTLYLDLPFLLEFQIPTDHSHLNIAAGPIGAIKLCSYSKMVYENGDKVKSNDDFSLNLLRYGATARVGFENFQIFGTYYVTPLFKEGKGPGSPGNELHPFEIGLAFTVD